MRKIFCRCLLTGNLTEAAGQVIKHEYVKYENKCKFYFIYYYLGEGKASCSLFKGNVHLRAWWF